VTNDEPDYQRYKQKLDGKNIPLVKVVVEKEEAHHTQVPTHVDDNDTFLAQRVARQV
jgi:hypothetical protein